MLGKYFRSESFFEKPRLHPNHPPVVLWSMSRISLNHWHFRLNLSNNYGSMFLPVGSADRGVMVLCSCLLASADRGVMILSCYAECWLLHCELVKTWNYRRVLQNWLWHLNRVVNSWPVTCLVNSPAEAPNKPCLPSKLQLSSCLSLSPDSNCFRRFPHIYHIIWLCWHYNLLKTNQNLLYQSEVKSLYY